MKSDAHILIVDDDRGIRDLLQEFFQKRGLRASVAADGDEMETVLRRGAVDLVVLDVMLPGKSGLELCRELLDSASLTDEQRTAAIEVLGGTVVVEIAVLVGFYQLISHVLEVSGRNNRAT